MFGQAVVLTLAALRLCATTPNLPTPKKRGLHLDGSYTGDRYRPGLGG